MTGAETALCHELIEALRPWLPKRRWFPLKGIDVELHILDLGEIQDPLAQARVLLAQLVLVPYTGSAPQLVQVPLTLREEAVGITASAVIGQAGGLFVIDGPSDPAFTRAVLALMDSRSDGAGGGPRASTPRVTRAEFDAALRDCDIESARVITGEQSNTSVIINGQTPLILKVFRVLCPGPNPDIEVSAALAEAGWGQVPRPFGWLEGDWPDEPWRAQAWRGEMWEEGQPSQDDPEVFGCVVQLAVLSEFLSPTSDGFELFCGLARDGEDASALAADLGRTTAQLHSLLAEVLAVDDEALPGSELADHLRDRAEWAIAAVPALEPYRSAIAAIYDTVDAMPLLPVRRRIHGDFHLGQTLWSPERGWIVLDFEGEPLRPLTERVRPDLPARDIAGMLRSFDYASAVGTAVGDDVGHRSDAALGWARRSREAFLDGYGLTSADAILLRSLELDKALYEVVYESRNRPAWLEVPMTAVASLVG